MSVTDVQPVYIRHAHTCIRHASGVLTEDMLTPAARKNLSGTPEKIEFSPRPKNKQLSSIHRCYS